MKRTAIFACALAVALIASSSRNFAGSPFPCEAVSGVIVTTGGSGYAAGDVGRVVTFSGGGGTGATGIIANVSGGAVTLIVMTNPGVGYTSVPTAAIPAPLGGGTTATGTPSITSLCPCGTVAGVIMTGGGTGYLSSDVGRSVAFAGGGGSGAAGIINFVAAGAVTAVAITTLGSGYTSPPVVTISPPLGGGTTATGTSVLGSCGVPTLPRAFLVSSIVAVFTTGALLLWPGQLALARLRRGRRIGGRPGA